MLLHDVRLKKEKPQKEDLECEKCGSKNISKNGTYVVAHVKKKLLNKQVNRILYRMRKGFKSRYAFVGTIYIEGALSELKELAGKFPSLSDFYKKTEKFINHELCSSWQ